MQYLPNDDEQEWLIRYLRKLIERAGWEHFVSAPILEPMRNWFPEAWSGTVHDAHIVTQRLMHYAGIGHLKVSLDHYESMPNDEGEERFDTAAYFSGIRDGRAHFGVQLSTLEDPEKAAGTMAHEVAHAWRAHHKLVVDESPDREELLTDITTIYLGFGIFTVNNTDRYRSEGDLRETRWSFSKVGYLPLQAMAFLLALQAVARDDRDETAKIERHLEANQQRAFREAMESFAGEDVFTLLDLPRTEWPDIERTPRDFDVYEPDASEAIEPPEEEEDPQRNRGRYVYRVDRGGTKPVSYALAITTFAGMMVFFLVEQPQRIPVLIATVVVLIAIAIIGGRSRQYACSDAECGRLLPRDAAACPGCGALIAPSADEALERNAADADFFECEECEPEDPCPRHAVTSR